MSNPQTLKIDDVEYVRADSVAPKKIIIQKNKTLASSMIGTFVIVRSRNEGINAGTVVAADETGVILADCRRIWYHKPADKSLSWYEGVAVSGLSNDSKVSGTVPYKVIIEDYSLTACSNTAKDSIMEKTTNAQ
jgi:hypothetical protein